MGKRGYFPERIIGRLRGGGVLLSQGTTEREAVRKLGISDDTYYRWRKEYGGMLTGQV